MPYPAHVLQKFKKEYGQKEGQRRFFAWKGANPGQYGKALKTAQREGGSHVASHSKVVGGMIKKKRAE
jgi:hypothetical protein